MPMFTGIAAVFYLSNCQRWDYIPSRAFRKESLASPERFPYNEENQILQNSTQNRFGHNIFLELPFSDLSIPYINKRKDNIYETSQKNPGSHRCRITHRPLCQHPDLRSDRKRSCNQSVKSIRRTDNLPSCHALCNLYDLPSSRREPRGLNIGRQLLLMPGILT